jgi:serine/threonine protein phosphatase PrpC
MILHTYTTQGKRNYQEDAYFVKLNINKNISSYNNITSETINLNRLNIDLFGVFDGHGGSDISKKLCKILPEYFYKQNIISDNIPKPTHKYNQYIISTFNEIQNIFNNIEKKSTNQGSTVCICIIYLYNNKKYITTFWVGDSRAIACNQNLIAVSLTLDHKPDNILEKRRIESLGGIITYEKHDVPRINNIIAVSRSLGDFDQKKFVDHIPEILHNICNYKFIVVATDGLWDVMSNQMVIDFIINEILTNPVILINNHNNKSELNIAYKLAQYAIKLGSNDNITIIIYFIENKIDNYNIYLKNFSINLNINI